MKDPFLVHIVKAIANLHEDFHNDFFVNQFNLGSNILAEISFLAIFSYDVQFT